MGQWYEVRISENRDEILYEIADQLKVFDQFAHTPIADSYAGWGEYGPLFISYQQARVFARYAQTQSGLEAWVE